MKRKLDDRTVRQIAPPATGRADTWDLLLPGFGVRTSLTGRKTWNVVRRKPGSPNPIRIKIGEFPAMDTRTARERARELMAAEPEEVEPKTFAQVVEAFLAHGRTRKGRQLRQNTLDQYRRNFATYAKALDNRVFKDIARRDIATLLAGIAKKHPTTAALVRSMLARLWSFGVEIGEVEYSVVIGTPGYEVPKGKRVLSDAEIWQLWNTTEPGEPYHVIVRLLLLLGCRRGEIGGLKWSELENGVLSIPGSRIKNHRDLVLVLPRQALVELAKVQRVVGRDHLFGDTSSQGFNGWDAAKARLDELMNFTTSWDLRDLRRTVETKLAELSVPQHIVNQLLNHAIGPITEAYNRYDYGPEKAEALQKWADELDRITSRPAAAVAPLERPAA